MDPITTMALIKGGTAIGKYAYNRWFNKRPGFKGSALAKYYQNIGNKGIYSPTSRSLIQGDVNRQAASIGDVAKNAYMGRMINRGNENSISNQRAMNEIDMNRARIASDTARRITMANEQSKVGARERYAQLAYGDRMGAYQERRQDFGDLMGGLGSAAGMYAMGRQDVNIGGFKTSDGKWDLEKIKRAINKMSPGKAAELKLDLIQLDPQLADILYGSE